MSIRVGIVGISGFGGGEAMRLVASHPSFELIYAAGEGSAGSRLVDRFPGVPAKLAELVIEKWDPVTLPKLDVLFASLPTGASAEALARVPKDVKIVDIGGDHRYVEGWAYGLADVWPAQIEGQIRVANPGCFPAATLNALAPLLVNKLIEPGNIVIDVKTGISGAGRGGADSKFGYAESNENLLPYGLLKHVHMPEIAKTIERLSELGYVHKAGDDQDRRRKLVRITSRGHDALALSAMIFDDIRSRWAAVLGPGQLSALEADLRTMVPGPTFRLDVPGWFGG